MPLVEMEHYLVVTPDPERTRDFYRDALGLAEGFRPRLAFPGYWLYLGDTPCIHIAERDAYREYLRKLAIPSSGGGEQTGPIDHIAFNGSDFEGMVARLERYGADFHHDTIEDIGLRQIFVRDPNGVKIELNFRDATR